MCCFLRRFRSDVSFVLSDALIDVSVLFELSNLLVVLSELSNKSASFSSASNQFDVHLEVLSLLTVLSEFSYQLDVLSEFLTKLLDVYDTLHSFFAFPAVSKQLLFFSEFFT